MLTIWVISAIVVFSISDASQSRVRRDAPEPEESLETQTSSYPDGGPAGSGAVYTRWGRQECPDSAELVYQGYAGGQHQTQAGGASNYLCLPTEPEWGNYNDAVQNHGLLYGSEYEVAYNAFDGLSSNGVTKINNQNVPCVVCHMSRASSVVMVPARRTCMSGWHAEYNGYLMSGHIANKGRTEYICVDGRPEADPSGYRNEDGALLYFVESICGSLPCPPYVNGRELTCVVCSK